MKHLLKIIFSAILCMAVSLTAVFICLKSGGVTGSESVKITAENGGKVEYGVYEQPNFAGVNFKGARLIGGTGATFNLGNIDISKSNWLGTATSVKANTASNKNNSFLEFAFHPTNKDNFTCNNSSEGGELSHVTFKISQGERFFEFKTVYYSYKKSSTSAPTYELLIRAKADNQSNWGAFRSNLSYLIANDTSVARKTTITKSDADSLGIYNNGSDLKVGFQGNSQTAFPFYFANNALYTPMTYTSTGYTDAYLIRDFDSTNVKYNNDTTTSNAGAITSGKAKAIVWQGFTADESGAVNVNVSVTFGTVSNSEVSSIIITKLGDNYLTEAPIEEEKQANINVINGSYLRYRNGEVVTDSVKEGDVLRFTPNNDAKTNFLLSDVKSLIINSNEYNFEQANNLLNKVETNDSVYYEIALSNDYFENSVLNLTLTFDRNCEIKVSNDKTVTTYNEWLIGGSFNFSNLPNFESENNVLIGYARTDVATKSTDGTFINIRNDYNVPNVNELGTLIYEKDSVLGSSAVELESNENLKRAYTIVPNMTFEAVYINLCIETEIKLTSGSLTDYSGLRFIVKFTKESLDNYSKFVINNNANPLGEVYNFITTACQIEKGGSGVTVQDITASSWYNDGWTSFDTANNLGLYNITNVTKPTNAGYIVKTFNENENVWNDNYTNAYVYAITINNFSLSNANKTYIFSPVIFVSGIKGKTENIIFKKAIVTPSELAKEKFTLICKTEEFSGYNYTYKDQYGVRYWSNYTILDAQWLLNISGSDIQLTAIN